MLMEDQEQDKPQLHVRLVEFIQLEDQLMFQVETTKLDQPINLEDMFQEHLELDNKKQWYHPTASLQYHSNNLCSAKYHNL